MGLTDSLRRQHEELLELIEAISDHLTLEAVDHQAEEIARLLETLSGKLKMHLAIEDKSLYPKLIASPDPLIRNMAELFVGQMGDLSKLFSIYFDEWSTSEALRENSQRFIIASRAIFEALKKRIERENNQLYPKLKTASGSTPAIQS